MDCSVILNSFWIYEKLFLPAVIWFCRTFVFFIAGFNTTSHLLQTLTYELAKNQDIQEELYQEVLEVLATLGGKPVTYEALHKMKYLDCVISEGLRMYPPAVQTDRSCSKPIDLDLGNGKTLHINKKEVITLPIYNIHHDSDYFPNPENFDPTRFNDENKSSIVAGSYLPFGMGQRACIGRLVEDFFSGNSNLKFPYNSNIAVDLRWWSRSCWYSIYWLTIKLNRPVIPRRNSPSRQI